MKKICVFTSTRADYGLLYWLMKDIEADPDLTLQIIVSGTHLSPEFGHTYRQIEDDGFNNVEKIPMQLSGDDATAVIKSVGLGMIGVADALARLQPDAAMVLGDRYETLGFAQATLLAQIPTIHLHGGELTQGAQDDAIRHAITKLCGWHCAATEAYCQRIIQMGEQPERVFQVGALGLDYVHRAERASRQELSQAFKFDFERPYFVLSFHPETLYQGEDEATPQEAGEGVLERIFKLLMSHSDHGIVMSYPNADQGHYEIIEWLKQWQQMMPSRILLRQSYGSHYYLSAMAHADVVVGNSSSAILEAPSLRTPSINVGNRQGGRLAAESVIHCDRQEASIKEALNRAMSAEFKKLCENVVNPYDAGGASKGVIRVLKLEHLQSVKTFYDLPKQTLPTK